MTSMLAWSFLAAVAAAAIPTATLAQDPRAGEAQAQCQQACKAFPGRAPPGCVCALVGSGQGAASKSLDDEDLKADELLQLVRDAEVERAAGIRDYWVVEHSNLTPLPTIRFYEKRSPGMWPPFRLVPPAEVQKRQLEQVPMKASDRAVADAVAQDPGSMVRAMGAAIAVTGAMLGGELPAGGELLGAKAMEVAAGFMDAAAGMDSSMAEMAAEREDDLDAFTEQLAPLFKDRPVLKGIYYPQSFLGSGRRRYVDREEWNASYPELGVGPDQRSPADEHTWIHHFREASDDPMACVVATYRGDAVIDGGAGDGETFVVEEAELWAWAVQDNPVPIYLRMVVRQGLRRIVLEKETTRWGWDQQRLLYFAGAIKQRLQGLSADSHEEHRKVEAGGVNEGVPSVEATTRVTGAAIGTPGADPTRP